MRKLQRASVTPRLRFLLSLEHGSLALGLLAGALLARELGWGIGRARWFDLKLGLVAFLLLPLEGMHAYVCHALILGGERRDRGFRIEEMLRTLEGVVLFPGVVLIVWLSHVKPF